jgi:hypothetical protein
MSQTAETARASEEEKMSDFEDAMAERDRAYVDLANAISRMDPARDGMGAARFSVKDEDIENLRNVAAAFATTVQPPFSVPGTNPDMLPAVMSAMLAAVAADEKVERIAGT